MHLYIYIYIDILQALSLSLSLSLCVSLITTKVRNPFFFGLIVSLVTVVSAPYRFSLSLSLSLSLSTLFSWQSNIVLDFH